MAEHTPTLVAGEMDTGLLKKLLVAERAALAAVIALAVLNLAGSFLPIGQRLMVSNWRLMSGESVLFALMSALSLLLLEPRRSSAAEWTGFALAAAVLLLCGTIAAGLMLHSTSSVSPIPIALQSAWLGNARISVQTASAFALLGLSVMFLRVESRAAVLIADLVTCCLAMLVMVLVSGQIIDMSNAPGEAANASHSLSSTACLFLLTAVTFFRRARRGFLSIFLGRGTGSRLARTLSPILLFLPYLREWARAHFMGTRSMPPPYTTAFLATGAMIVATSVLLYCAWRINGMEAELHALSLRDELTRLSNLRGFRLLAEQSLRVAHRAGHPFSVLFIDFDELKGINDRLGHLSGSQCLVETAAILRSVFRETDVLGRIGGDEFAVAGEFSEPGMMTAIRRLKEAIEQWNAEPHRQIAISLSFGTVTSDAGAQATLDTLISLADQAMYRNKRDKKTPDEGNDDAVVRQSG
jgi:diguanylate cyclase (GGDEF)-like protein